MRKLIIISFGFFININTTYAETIKVAADPWCPITCDANSEKPGVLIEVAKKIFEAEGYEFIYESIAWAKAVDDTRENKFNAVAGALQTDAPDFIFPESSVIMQKSCFFTKNRKSKYQSDLKFLEGQTLGIVKDYTYGNPLDDYVKTHEKSVDAVFGTNTTQNLFLKLISNKIQVFVEDKSVADYFLFSEKNIEGTNEIINAGCLKPEPLYIAFSPKNPKSKEYADIFSKGVTKLAEKKELQKIFSKYGLVFSKNR